MEWVNNLISPSRLDSFAQYKSGYVYNFGDNSLEYTTELFIDRLLRLESPENFLKADAGTSVHKVIELSKYGNLLNAYKVDDWIVSIPSDVEFNLHVPRMREVPVRGCIDGINIKGRVDSMDGVAVHDIKTTGKIDIDKYIDSYQWKCYLMMTGLDNFVYDIIKVDVKEDIKKVIIQDYCKLTLCRYTGMDEEVTNIVREYYNTLIMLAPRLIARVNEYNNKLESLSDKLELSLEWAHTAHHEIKLAIEQIKNKKLIIKGLNT